MKRFCRGASGSPSLRWLVTTRRRRAAGRDDRTHEAAAAAKLPALPANVKSRSRWLIGVKCDVPPFGYIDVKGKNAGFDVEVARWFARYAFGKANQRHVRLRADGRPRAAADERPRRPRRSRRSPTPPTATARIDFSRAVLQGDGPAARARTTARSRTLARHRRQEGRDDERLGLRPLDEELLQGHPACIVADTFTNALLAFQQGRADAVMYDDAVLLPVAAADRNSKLTDDTFLEAPFGIGIKQGNTAMKAWVDSRLGPDAEAGPVLPDPQGERRRRGS